MKTGIRRKREVLTCQDSHQPPCSLLMKTNNWSPLSCPLDPSWSKQTAALPGSGSHGGFLPVKREFFSLHSRLVHAQDGGLDQ